MNKIRSILKSERGASLIIVMAIMLLLFATGVSVVVAASTTMSTSRAQADAENVHRYLAELARTVEDDITKTELTGTEKSKPWYMLARYVYDKKYENIGNNVSIEIKNFQVETDQPLWVSQNNDKNKTNITGNLTEQQLSRRIVYMPEVREQKFDDKGDPVTDAGGNNVYEVISQEVLEECDIKIKVDVHFEAVYEGRKYGLTAKYIMNGTVKRCVGDPLGTCSVSEGQKCTSSMINGEFSLGKWVLEGYTKN